MAIGTANLAVGGEQGRPQPADMPWFWRCVRSIAVGPPHPRHDEPLQAG